jgi:hypothetical protein
MATTAVRKQLAQSMPAATTDTVVYTVPASTDTVVASIVVCETNAVAATFKITVDTAGGTATAAAKSIAWNMPIAANATVVLKLGLTLPAGTKIIINNSTANIAISAYGQENS